MNLNRLEYFVNVAETLNFTKAAEKCFISQTAMSQQIKALEEAVGVPLLIRDKHHVELTAAGRVFLNEARGILIRSNEAMRLARIASEGAEGKLCIGFIRGYEHSDLPEMLRAFHMAFPNISISLLRENSSPLYDAIEQGKCDLAFTIAPFSRKGSELAHRYISSYALMAVVFEGHPFADRGSISYRELSEEKFIIMQPQGRPRDEAEEAMVCYERGGFFPDIVASEGESETVLVMVEAGLGISVLPEYILRNRVLSRGLRSIPILKEDGSAETLDFELCRAKQLTPAAEKFLEWSSNWKIVIQSS
ncbi:MAG: LysR family transcriptional regulator [Eubacteriales bacterium]|nr:LysR family transcriptional regulator [Eubacteriales bacterium]